MSVDIRKLLLTTVEMNASDLHIVTGEPPVVRVRGEIRRLNMPALPKSCRLLDQSSQIPRAQFAEELSVDFSFSLQKSALSCQHFHASQRSQYSPSDSSNCSDLRRSKRPPVLNDRRISKRSCPRCSSHGIW